MAYDYDGRERGPRAPRWGDDRWRDAPTPPDFWERPPPPPPLPPALPPPPAWRDPHAAPDPRERAAEPDAVDEPRVKRLRLDADVYETIGQVGEGTYAKVFKARNQRTGGFVAVKRLRMENERDGFPFTAIREIKFLTSLAHENILQVQEAVSYRINTAEGRKVEYALVFEYMDHDLAGLLHSKQHAFEEVQIKCLVRQMLRGLDFLHSKGILHRDIKAANVLLNEKLQLKLADFGLARHATGRRSETKADCMTNRVVTLWYRAPELCLGSTKYGPEIDIWSVGCVMLEFFTYKAVFTGSDEISQLNSIWQICGTPNESNWPGIVHMEWYSYLKPKVVRPRTLLASCRAWKLPELAADLVDKLLEIDPSARPSAREAIKHPWFSSDPLPCERPHIPINTQGRSWHEFESKKRNGKQEANSTPEAGGGPSAPAFTEPHALPKSSFAQAGGPEGDAGRHVGESPRKVGDRAAQGASFGRTAAIRSPLERRPDAYAPWSQPGPGPEPAATRLYADFRREAHSPTDRRFGDSDFYQRQHQNAYEPYSPAEYGRPRDRPFEYPGDYVPGQRTYPPPGYFAPPVSDSSHGTFPEDGRMDERFQGHGNDPREFAEYWARPSSGSLRGPYGQEPLDAYSAHSDRYGLDHGHARWHPPGPSEAPPEDRFAGPGFGYPNHYWPHPDPGWGRDATFESARNRSPSPMRSSRAGLHDDRPAVSAGGLRRSDGAPNQDASFLPGPIAIPSTTEITPVSPHRFGGERRASGAELSALGAVPQLDISPAARPDKASTGQALPGHAAAEVKDLRERRLDNRSREVGTKRLRPADDQQPVRPSEAAVLARRDVGRAGPTETRTGNDVPDASQAKKRRTVLEGGVIMAEAITEQAMLSKARLADPPPPLKPPRDRSGAALVSAPKLGTTSPSEKLRSPEGRFAEVPLDGLPLPAQRRAGARAALPETNPHPSSRNKRDVAPTGAWATSVSAPKTVGTIPSSRALDAALELEGAAAVGQQSAIQQRSQPDSTHSNATGGLSEQIGMEPAARAERHSPVAMEVDRPGPRRNDSASLTDPWNVETSALDAVLSSVGLPPIRASREVARASSGWQMTRSQAAELARPEKEAIVKLLETDEWAGHLTDEHLAARNLGPPTSFSGSGGALSIEIDEPAQQLIEALQRLEELQAVSNAGDPLIMLNKAKWTKSPRGRMVRYPTLPGRANAPALEVRTQGRYDHSYAKRSPAVRKMIAGPKPPVANPAGSPDPIAN